MNDIVEHKLDTGPLGFVMSLGYAFATIAALYLEKVLGSLGLSVYTIGLYAFLMAIDFITGIWKARRLGEVISSQAAKEGFYEKAVTILCLVTMAAVLKVAGVNSASLVNVFMTIGALIEAYSIFGNLISIRTRLPVAEQDALTYVMRSARKKLFDWLKKLLKTDDA
jgi:phage-related holin